MAIERLVVVQSSMVHAVGYDRGAHVLEVVFNDGGIFLYRDVPYATYRALLAAPSVGHFMQNQIIDVFVTGRMSRTGQVRWPRPRRGGPRST